MEEKQVNWQFVCRAMANMGRVFHVKYKATIAGIDVRKEVGNNNVLWYYIPTEPGEYKTFEELMNRIHELQNTP